jgi:hypothetical protein
LETERQGGDLGARTRGLVDGRYRDDIVGAGSKVSGDGAAASSEERDGGEGLWVFGKMRHCRPELTSSRTLSSRASERERTRGKRNKPVCKTSGMRVILTKKMSFTVGESKGEATLTMNG